MDLITTAHKLYADARMDPDELKLIRDFHKKHYKGGHTLEIGAYKGMTSFLIVNLIHQSKVNPKGKHYIVDIFDEGQEDNWAYEPYSEEMLTKNLGDNAHYADVRQGRSLDHKSIEWILSREYDYVFIDGDHRHATLIMELMMTDLVTDHITGHDYGHSGVTLAVDQFCKSRGYKVNVWDGRFGLFNIIKNNEKDSN